MDIRGFFSCQAEEPAPKKRKAGRPSNQEKQLADEKKKQAKAAEDAEYELVAERISDEMEAAAAAKETWHQKRPGGHTNWSVIPRSLARMLL